MASGQERRTRARSARAGTVSRFAQQRVDDRVMEIMSNRDTVERRASPADRALSARRTLRRSVTSRV
jgi:hypothetical protein